MAVAPLHPCTVPPQRQCDPTPLLLRLLPTRSGGLARYPSTSASRTIDRRRTTMSTLGREEREYARATLLALVTISTDEGHGEPPAVYFVAPDTTRLTLDQAARALVEMTKPVSCGGRTVANALTIECRSRRTLAEITEHENTTAFWSDGLLRALQRVIGTTSRARRIVVRGRGDSLLMTIDDMLTWLRQYGFRDKLGFDVDETDSEARSGGADAVVTFRGPGADRPTVHIR